MARSGAAVSRSNPRAPRGEHKKLPKALQFIVKEAISQTASASTSSSYEVPQNAPMCVVGEKKIEFEVYAQNQSSIGQPCTLDFYLYDIDAREVEGVIQGAFGYLQPKERIESVLYIPEMLYPGRKILVTSQDNADRRVSEVFYSIER